MRIEQDFLLSQESKVAFLIFENNKRDTQIYFAKLVEMLSSQMSRATVSRVIDKLFDKRIVIAEWEKNKEPPNGWIRSLYISGEYESYFNQLFDLIADNKSGTESKN